jgi:(4-(4-[2-(gamma-L-glutamylamino)ethyl]phenoxymethyl)furan-2-yl)methanamine synthase
MQRRQPATVAVLGFDIGGANTKAAFLITKEVKVTEFASALEYFPFWKRHPNELSTVLLNLKTRLAGSQAIDIVAITMTAELSDVYSTKREGVNHILDNVTLAFEESTVLVLDISEDLQSVETARTEPLRVASANWAATGWLVAQKIPNAVVIDAGSTTTSIIPVANCKVAAEGKTDLEKLINGELVYTGSLRTNVAAIVNSIPVNGNLAKVSSELFAQSGDVHLLLGFITEEEYIVETADGKGKTRKEASARLARLVCADTEMLSDQEILEIAKHVYEQQVEQIAESVGQVYSRMGINAKQTIPAIVTGLGRKFLAQRAAKKAGITKILDLDALFPKSAALASPAAAVALMAATKLEGRQLSWTP